MVKDKIEIFSQKRCLNDFFRGKNYNLNGYRGKGRGARKGGFIGGYASGCNNKNQQATNEGNP